MKVFLPSKISKELYNIHEIFINYYLPNSKIQKTDDKTLSGLYLDENCFICQEPDFKTLLKGARYTRGVGWRFNNYLADNNKNTIYTKIVKLDISDDSYSSCGCFLIFSDLTRKNMDILRDKILELKETKNEVYLPQDLISSVIRYWKERKRWKKAGSPIRSDEEVQKIFNICNKCEYYEKTEEDSGICTICGCGVKRDSNDTTFNKLTWATTKCPLKEPRWE